MTSRISQDDSISAPGPENNQPCSLKFVLCLKKTYSLFLAIIFGVIIGLAMKQRKEPYSKREVMYAGFAGSLLIRMLKCITIPLFTTSVMSALGRLNMKTSGMMSIRTMIYFLVTSFISTVLGTVLVVLIQPGTGQNVKSKPMVVKHVTIVDNFLDIIRNIFPSNLIEAAMYTHTTVLIEPKNNKTIPLMEWDFEVNHLTYSSNFLGLIVASAAIGFAMGYMGETVRLFTDFTESVNDLFINITFLIISVSAPGVFSLILGQILEVHDFLETLKQVGLYTLCCIIGLTMIATMIIPVTYIIFIRKLPFRMLFNALPVITTAFATASSLATMPTTLKCVEEKIHVDPRVSRFVIPLGATVNMNGAALYNTVGPLFLAQLGHLELTITATLASVGVAAIPQAGVVTMVMVMSVLNVDPGLIGIIYTMDWLLDRFCTAVNVLGDVVAAVIIEKLSRKQLDL
uniref:Amino acid transporter n=1 Tax=Strigamia maritima TaxID=126957 RepID=T1JEG3_STRMM